MKQVILSWSGGKDSVLTLDALLRMEQVKVVGLLTTVRLSDDCVPLHYVPVKWVISQARSLQLPLAVVRLTDRANESEWKSKITAFLRQRKEENLVVAYGDIFLEDIHKYREDFHREIGMECMFPIWKKDTGQLADHFLNEGFKAVVTSVNLRFLDASFAGRIYDKKFLDDLPSGVDSCGENGEFHSFGFEGPIFENEIPFRLGPTREVQEGEGDWQVHMAHAGPNLLGKHSSSIQNSGWELKSCHRCGTVFDCGSNSGRCWCSDLPPVDLPITGEDCLCPQCLGLQLNKQKRSAK
jgi:uncharacterized protein (TIGR00290 family)